MSPWVRGKHVFVPRMTIEHTGFSGNRDWQWCLRFVSRDGRTSECGGPLVSTATPEQAWQYFRDFMVRIKCEYGSRIV